MAPDGDGNMSKEIEVLTKHPVISFLISLALIFGLSAGFIVLVKYDAYNEGYRAGYDDGRISPPEE